MDLDALSKNDILNRIEKLHDINLPNNLVMYDSYHCSRYNTQTKRLTEEMFHEVFLSIKTEMEN